ncbi:hypothetical protein, partial [Antarcticibacterium sp. W02-3]|uniref:hypothetical protein n=1 Tax=Antarcticibacterium sp. W02-3 TaxID=2183747 RepID=UPI0020430FE6
RVVWQPRLHSVADTSFLLLRVVSSLLQHVKELQPSLTSRHKQRAQSFFSASFAIFLCDLCG